MKMLRGLACALFLCAVSASGQFVTITDTGITDVTGAPLVNGQECFMPVNNQRVAIGASYSGGTITKVSKCSPVTNGTMSPVQLVNSNVTSPAHLCYQRTITDLTTGKQVVGPQDGWGCVQPTANTNMNTVPPATGGISLVTTGPPGATGPQGPQGIAGSTLDIARAPLETILECLHNAANQVCNVGIYGDSFGVVDQSNFGTGPVLMSNLYSQQLRINLQSQFGSHGTGLVPLFPALEDFNSKHVVNTDFYAATGTWAITNTMGPYQGTTAGNGSLMSANSGVVVTFTTTQAWDTMHVYCAANGSSGSWAVSVDGSSVGTGCGSNPGSITAIKSDMTAGTSSTSHVATLTCSATPCYLYGVEGTLGTTGVSVHNFSVGSASITFFGAVPSTQLAFSDLVAGGMQGVITEQFTNEPAWDTTSQFTTAMEALIDHIQGLNTNAPASVLVFLSPVDVVCAGGGCTPYTAPTLALATARNVYIVNAQDRWGTTYNASSGLWSISPDLAPGIHPNDKGARDLYSQIWAAFVDPVPLDGKGVGSVSIALDTSGTSGAATITGNPTIGYTLHIPNLTAACPSNFCFTINPTSKTFVPGLAATQTFPVAVTENSQAGYSSTVTYSGTSLPSGFSGSASPSTIASGSGTTTFTASFPYNQASGSSNFTVSGTDGTNTHTQTETFTVGTENNNLSQGWIMNEGTGTTAVSTPTGDNLTLSNTTWGSTTGFPGSSLIFNGGTSIANAANDTNTNFDGTTAFSAACWINPVSITVTDQYILSTMNQSTGSGPWWGFEVTATSSGAPANGSFHVHMTDGTLATGVWTSAPAITAGQPNLVGFSYTGGKTYTNITAYVNGAAPATVSAASTSITGTLASGAPVNIGNLLLSIQPAGSFGGTIGACRIASRAWTSGEWSALYAAGPK